MSSLELSRSPLDDALRLVTGRRRRLVLRHLMQTSTNQSSLDELADHLMDAFPADRPISRETILTRLQHKDLPALEHHGVIDYDSRTGAIRYRPNDRIERLLECLPED